MYWQGLLAVEPLFTAQQLRGPASTWWGNFVAIQPAGHQVTWDEFMLAFREHYISEGMLHMKQEEFMRLKQGGDTVMQYLNKFNHLSQYAIDQVNTDLKKKNCFMRGFNDRLQRKMATCLDLTYSRSKMMKPDEAIFRHVLMNERMLPDETLFIDDGPRNCAAASQLGISLPLHSSQRVNGQYP